MKKIYQKPMVLIEDCTVTETIAYSCGVKVDHTTKDTCDIQNIEMNNSWDRYNMFIESLSCTVPPENDETCFHSAVLSS